MIKQEIIPESQFLTLKIPKNYINKKIEIIIFPKEDAKKEQYKYLKEFEKISQNISKINSKIDILKLEDDVNNDIF